MHWKAVIEGVWWCIWRPRSCKSEMHLEAVIVRVGRCIWRPRSCNSEMHLEAFIEQVCRCTSRPWSCDSEMHLEALIGRVGRCTWRPRLCYSEMRLEAVIEWVWRCIWRPRSCNSEMHLEAGTERGWRSKFRRSIEGVPGAETLSISWSTRNCGNVMRWLWLQARMESWLLAVDLERRHSGSWSYMQGSTHNCENEGKPDRLGLMLWSVYAVLSVNSC